MAAVASMWYFASDRSKVGFSSVKTAFSWAIFYHMGSIAIGSFLLAFVWLLKKLVEAAEHSAKQRHGHNNPAAVLMLACLLCIGACLEEVMKFITTHSYIEIVLHNTNFYKGSLQFATLIYENILTAGRLKGIATIIVYFGMFSVFGLTIAIGLVLMKFFPLIGGPEFESLAPLFVRF